MARLRSMAQRSESLDHVLVITPTYNEAENIESIIGRLRAAVPNAYCLIADDNSPDGTGAIADRMAAQDKHIHVLHRAGKEGLAAAYLAGFKWGLERGFDVIAEMDADGSHQPELLPAMLRAAALRFWISRLWDFHLPREASMLVPHDPTHFERVLRERIAHPLTLADAPVLA